MKRRQFIAKVTAATAGAALSWERFGSRAASAPAAALADATAELQALLDKGGQIILEAGRRYLVRGVQPGQPALTLRSDTSLDLRGAVLELVPGSRSSLLTTDKRQRTRNIRISGGEIVGNGSRQPTDYLPKIGITPTLYFPGCDNLEVRDVHIRDAYMYAIHAIGDHGIVDRVTVRGAVGGGIAATGCDWHVDEVDVSDVTYFERVNCQGNPFIVRLTDSTIGAIKCENYGFGVKFQDGCRNVTVDSIIARGGPNNEPHPNPLVKIQGMRDARGKHFNQHLQIKSIICEGGSVSGLYVIYSDDVRIDRYSGRDNCRLPHPDRSYSADVLLLESNRIRFGLLNAEAVRHYGLWVDKRAQNIDVEQLKLSTNTTGANAELIQSSTVKIHKHEFTGFSA